MDKPKNKKHIISLIIISVLTLLVWNNYTFGVLLGNFNSFSILIIFAYIMIFLPIITAAYCAVKLIINKNVHIRIWLIGILSFNILFYVMLGGYYFSRGNTPYPDMIKILETSYVNVFVKNNASERVEEYLQYNYGEQYSFSVKSGKYSTMPDASKINYIVHENNNNFYFNLSYDIYSKTIVFDNFKVKLAHDKVNKRLKELIDGCIIGGSTLYVRWDNLYYDYLSFPLYATADEILAGKYGRVIFDTMIFVYTGEEKIGLREAKNMYLSILKNYCFVNMSYDNESQTSQMQLGSANFSIYFVDKKQYNKVWLNTTIPGEGESMTSSYASIGYGMSFRHLAKNNLNPIFDTEQIYESVKQYLDTYYLEQYW